MGQKANPIGLRLAIRKKWESNWYATKQTFGKQLVEDVLIRNFLKKQPSCAGSASFVIRRIGDKIEVTICTARPGLVIGKKGVEIDLLKEKLNKLINKEVWIEVEEIKRPDLNASLVAQSIAAQLGRRVSFRRVLKKSMQNAMDAGAVGIKVQCGGRIGGAEIARKEWYKDGKIPLQTLRYDIDYSAATARTSYGSIGVKVWITLGEFIERAIGQ